MLNKETIDTLSKADAIREANVLSGLPIEVIALPDNFNLHDIEDKQPTRRRQRGTFQTSSIDSLCEYVERHAENGATVFVSDDMKAKAVLNLGNQDAPGHADNIAQLALVKTAAFDAVSSIHGQQRTQKEVAEFFEDWSEHLEFYQGAAVLPSRQAIAAVRQLTIEGVRKLESTTAQLSETRSSFEQVTASSKEPIPELVYFKCTPYEGLEERTFVLRVSILTTDDKPRLVLRIQRLQLHVEQMASELAQTVSDQLVAQSISVVRGTYTRG